MSAYGDERLIVTLYKYRPASVRALAGLAYADRKNEAARVYFADVLRLIALKGVGEGAELPTLTEFLAPRDNRTADEVWEWLLSRLDEG